MGRKQSNIIDFVMKTMKQILLVPNQWVLVLNVRRMPEFNYLAGIFLRSLLEVSDTWEQPWVREQMQFTYVGHYCNYCAPYVSKRNFNAARVLWSMSAGREGQLQ